VGAQHCLLSNQGIVMIAVREALHDVK
jgi:hypothetical protein